MAATKDFLDCHKGQTVDPDQIYKEQDRPDKVLRIRNRRIADNELILEKRIGFAMDSTSRPQGSVSIKAKLWNLLCKTDTLLNCDGVYLEFPRVQRIYISCEVKQKHDNCYIETPTGVRVTDLRGAMARLPKLCHNAIRLHPPGWSWDGPEKRFVQFS